MLNLFSDLFFFSKQFQSQWVYKVFSYTKNQILILIWTLKKKNKKKQLSIKVLQFSTRRENMLDLIYLSSGHFSWEEGGSCPWGRGNYKDEKSSERQFFSGAIAWGQLSSGQSFIGQLSFGGNFPLP